MQQRTGYETGTGYEPLVGSAEILARDDEPSEFGLPVGNLDPTQYRGKTPQPDKIIGVDESL